MGRPFIIYDDDSSCSLEEPSPSASCTYNTYDSWAGAARLALNSCCEDERPDSSSPEVDAILAYLFSKRRVAFLPNCEPSQEGNLGLLESKVGGLPYLLPSESWPFDNGRSLIHLWQLRVNELPVAVQRTLGYTRGLLQVFLSNTPEDEDKWFHVRVLEEAQLVHRHASAIVPGPNRLLDVQRITSYTAAYDFPNFQDALTGLPDCMDQDMVMYVYDVLQVAGLYTTLPGNKLLGWPRFYQSSEWRDMEAGDLYMQFTMQVEGTADDIALLLQRHPRNGQQWDVICA